MARSTEIRLAAGSDCLMLSNATTDDSDICINGGIWNFNNKNQSPNPIETGKYTCGETCDDGAFMTDYMGVIMRFCGIERFTLANVTLKDPIPFAQNLPILNISPLKTYFLILTMVIRHRLIWTVFI